MEKYKSSRAKSSINSNRRNVSEERETKLATDVGVNFDDDYGQWGDGRTAEEICLF